MWYRIFGLLIAAYSVFLLHPAQSNAGSFHKVCNKGNVAVSAAVSYEYRPDLDLLNQRKAYVEGWYHIKPGQCKIVWQWPGNSKK